MSSDSYYTSEVIYSIKFYLNVPQGDMQEINFPSDLQTINKLYFNPYQVSQTVLSLVAAMAKCGKRILASSRA